jgi:outer membrane autotransporter protein
LIKPLGILVVRDGEAVKGFSNSLSSSYQAQSAQFFGEIGYELAFIPVRTELFAALAHVHLSTPYFSESSGAAALTVTGSSSNTTLSTLGVRGDKTFKLGEVNATAKGMLGWRHAFGDTIPKSTNAFVLGSSFSVDGVAIAKNAVVLSAGVDLHTSQQVTFGIYYDGQFGGGSQQHGVSANLRVLF